MELINSTRMVTGFTMGMEPSGRELLVIVIKGTFEIPTESGATLKLSDEQVPLVTSDKFHGEPGLSAPEYEVDFAPTKVRCDILLNGSAYAPDRRPTDRVTVGLRVGQWSKAFRVFGDRVWAAKGIGARPTSPEPFEVQPFHYGTAFGGVDNRLDDPSRHAAFARNPAGRGFLRHSPAHVLDGELMPNTEELNSTITGPTDDYAPMAFGPVGRQWQPRVRLAGTYDQAWLDDVAPFLPADFDNQYYQAAPQDQQLALPLGEQAVTLLNLTADGRRDFLLPHFDAPIHVFPKAGNREDVIAPVDTVVLEPDKNRVTMTWRIARPLRKNIFEIAQVLVGRKGKEWWQQRETIGFPIPVVVERMGTRALSTTESGEP